MPCERHGTFILFRNMDHVDFKREFEHELLVCVKNIIIFTTDQSQIDGERIRLAPNEYT